MKTDLNEVIYKIKELIIEKLELDVDIECIEDDELILDGRLGIDSVSTIVLIEAVENEFNVEVEDEDISNDIFQSVHSLSEYVYTKINNK